MSIKEKIALNNEEGSGLVLALMVLLVLSVLGASLGVVTIGSLQLSNANRDSNSAYYIAEAGANRAYEQFKEDVKKIYKVTSDKDSFFNLINTDSLLYEDIFEEQFGNKPKAEITIKNIGEEGKSRQYRLESTGMIGGRERTVGKDVVISWIDKPEKNKPLKIPKNAVLMAKESISIGFSGRPLWFEYVQTIKGDIYVESSKSESIRLNTYRAGLGGNYPEIFLKQTDWDMRSRFNSWYVGWTIPYNTYTSENFNWEIAAEYANRLGVEKTELDIEALPYKSKELVLEKNNYRIEGGIKFVNESRWLEELKIKVADELLPETEGEGRHVTLFADSLRLEKLKINLEGLTKDDSLTIVVSGDINIRNTTFNSINMENSKKPNVRIVSTGTGAINIHNNSAVYGQIIAPKSMVSIDRSQVYGSIIAKEAITSNHWFTRHKTLIYQGFEFSDIGAGNRDVEGDLEDLFMTEPAIETD